MKPDPRRRVPAADLSVLTRRAGRVVARVETTGGPVVLKADEASGAFGVEAAAIDRLAAAEVPVPRVLLHRPGPPEVLILSWTGGRPLSATSALPAQRDAGRILRAPRALLTQHVLDGYQPTAQERKVLESLIPFFTVIPALAAAEWNLRYGVAGTVPLWLARASSHVAAVK